MRENAKPALLTPTPGVTCSRRPMIPMNHMKQDLAERTSLGSRWDTRQASRSCRQQAKRCWSSSQAPRVDAFLFPGDKQRGKEGDRNEITVDCIIWVRWPSSRNRWGLITVPYDQPEAPPSQGHAAAHWACARQTRHNLLFKHFIFSFRPET